MGTDPHRFQAWRAMLVLMETNEAKISVFVDACADVASQTIDGRLKKSIAVDELIEEATIAGLINDVGREEIERIIGNAFKTTSNGKNTNHKTHSKGPVIKSSSEFVAGFIPPDYLIDGFLQEGFLYSLTGQTGAGKTSITLRLAASTALGIIFANRQTKKKRVLYLAGENPDDVRMRWIAMAQHMDFDVDNIEVFFIEGVFKISQMAAALKREAERVGGDFGLVIIDTSPAFYEGDDENNRTQQGRHAEMLRGLIGIIPGKPTVIANCHPTKNAGPENLIPAGGGNFLNQVDGNLTAAKSDSTIELHWQGKFRGVEFAPMQFLLKNVTHERLKDSKGRLVPTVICECISDTAKEEIAAQKTRDEDQMLAFIKADPKASQASLAIKMGWTLYSGEPHKTKVKRCIASLKRDKLIKETRGGNYKLTAEGEKVLAQE